MLLFYLDSPQLSNALDNTTDTTTRMIDESKLTNSKIYPIFI